MIADPLWFCVMLLCGPLWVFCGPLRYLVIPIFCSLAHNVPLRYSVIPFIYMVEQDGQTRNNKF